MVDVHCHVLSDYYDDIDEVIARAYDSGVKAIIVNGYNMKSNREILKLVEKYDIVYGALGIQPGEILEYTDENLEFIEKHINDNGIVAVGEIGLDYHYDCDRDRQKELFKRQLDIAKRNNKPVIVHSRDCIKETYDILRKSSVCGILHCYSGSVEMAWEFIRLGFFISVGGIATFKNARKLVEVIKNIPLEYIVLETDCPYLAPVPYRGKRNEPSYIGVILQKICEIKGLDYKEVEDVTTNSVIRLFDKKIKL